LASRDCLPSKRLSDQQKALSWSEETSRRRRAPDTVTSCTTAQPMIVEPVGWTSRTTVASGSAHLSVPTKQPSIVEPKQIQPSRQQAFSDEAKSTAAPSTTRPTDDRDGITQSAPFPRGGDGDGRCRMTRVAVSLPVRSTRGGVFTPYIGT